jgi:gluconolactonase
MTGDLSIGRTLRPAGPPEVVDGFAGVQVDDARLREVLAEDSPLLRLHTGAIHAEGTAWQPGAGRLLWSDVPNRRLNAWYPDGRVEVVIDAAPFPNGNAVLPDGSLVHCEHGRRCISRSPAEPAGLPEPLVARYRGRRLNSPNDVTVAPDGAIWFTDPTFGILMPAQGCVAEPELDHRSVYRFDGEAGELRRMADFEQPNGLAFSPDGRTLYVTDTALSNAEAPSRPPGRTHEVVAFDVGADGELSNRRVLRHTDHGVPDGLRVDRRGWVWVTAADGVHVWSPAGEPLGFIPTPSVASNCAFGGEDGRRLFIAASEHLFAIDLLQPG